jgi:hypothetical protein
MESGQPDPLFKIKNAADTPFPKQTKGYPKRDQYPHFFFFARWSPISDHQYRLFFCVKN